MKICYLDCFSGVSGDMLLGALVDAGVNADLLKEEIAKLGLTGIDLHFEVCRRASIGGTNAIVDVASDHSHRSLSRIETIITESSLDDDIKAQSLRIFRRLGEVEASIHQVPIETVHFHEVGALDAIVDIVGSCVGFRLLDIEKIYSSPINVGSGTVQAAHGVMPVPAPATAALLKDTPTYSAGPAVELTTPTGAAIITDVVDEFGSMPAMIAKTIGYGAGDLDFKERSNLLRIVVGENTENQNPMEVAVIEANIDDMTPQLAGYVSERLFDAGALDVTLTPIFMKKGRPGFMVSALSAVADLEKLSHIIFSETTTLGIRHYSVNRNVLARQWKKIETKYGSVKMKVALEDGVIRTATPEYEDCKKIALEKNIPLKIVLQEANREYFRIQYNETTPETS